jgi:hypothetical protein
MIDINKNNIIIDDTNPHNNELFPPPTNMNENNNDDLDSDDDKSNCGDSTFTDKSNSDDDNSNSDESEDDINITFKPESDQYIIIKDGIPVGYVDNLIKAQYYMWLLARNTCNFTCIKEMTQNHIKIIVTKTFFMIPYDLVHSTFEIYSIKQIIDENPCINENLDSCKSVPIKTNSCTMQ